MEKNKEGMKKHKATRTEKKQRNNAIFRYLGTTLIDKNFIDEKLRADYILGMLTCTLP